MEVTSIILLFRTLAVILATAFNVSVIVFITRKRVSEAAFQSFFFCLFLAVSATECVFNTTVRCFDRCSASLRLDYFYDGLRSNRIAKTEPRKSPESENETRKTLFGQVHAR